MLEHVNTDQERLLAAVAAALLGSQGSPAWTRTAESLLLSSAEVTWHFRAAQKSVDELLGDELSGRSYRRDGG